MVAGEVYLEAGADVIMGHDGAEKNFDLPFGYCALEAVGSVYQEVPRFLQFERATRTMDECPSRFDLLRRKA